MCLRMDVKEGFELNLMCLKAIGSKKKNVPVACGSVRRAVKGWGMKF